MAKHIVNKHFETSEEIVRDIFNEDDEIAKGEIAIYNGETPSIFVLNASGVPVQISGGGSGGDISEEKIEEILSGVTEQINAISQTIEENNTIVTEALTDLSSRTEALESIDHEAYKDADAEIISSYTADDLALEQALTQEIENVGKFTVNGKELNTNPVLKAEDISVGLYSSFKLPEDSKENIVTDDSTQTALKKVENMVIANALAFSAALNDVNRKTKQMVVESVKDENDNYVLVEGCLNVINDYVYDLNFKFEENEREENVVCSYDVLFTTGDNIRNINLPVQYFSLPLENLESFTKYIFKFKYDFVEIVKLYTNPTNPV